MTRIKSGLAVVLGLMMSMAACAGDIESASDSTVGNDAVARGAEEQREYELYIAAQEAVPVPQLTAKAVEELAASGRIDHGGSIGDDYHVYTVGGRCTTGYVRTRVIHVKTGNGWGGVGEEGRPELRWVAPNDPTDCRARVWTKNAGAWLRGHLDWFVYQERVTNGHYYYCTMYGPCGHGKGHCTSDSQCRSGHSCTRTAGAEYGLPGWISVCENTLPPGHFDFCRVNGPCEEGEGDCDGDAECLPGLVCGNNNGATYDLPAWVDACR
jgi:hypothetical protein